MDIYWFYSNMYFYFPLDILFHFKIKIINYIIFHQSYPEYTYKNNIKTIWALLILGENWNWRHNMLSPIMSWVSCFFLCLIIVTNQLFRKPKLITRRYIFLFSDCLMLLLLQLRMDDIPKLLAEYKQLPI